MFILYDLLLTFLNWLWRKFTVLLLKEPGAEVQTWAYWSRWMPIWFVYYHTCQWIYILNLYMQKFEEILLIFFFFFLTFSRTSWRPIPGYVRTHDSTEHTTLFLTCGPSIQAIQFHKHLGLLDHCDVLCIEDIMWCSDHFRQYPMTCRAVFTLYVLLSFEQFSILFWIVLRF